MNSRGTAAHARFILLQIGSVFVKWRWRVSRLRLFIGVFISRGVLSAQVTSLRLSRPRGFMVFVLHQRFRYRIHGNGFADVAFGSVLLSGDLVARRRVDGGRRKRRHRNADGRRFRVFFQRLEFQPLVFRQERLHPLLQVKGELSQKKGQR